MKTRMIIGSGRLCLLIVGALAMSTPAWVLAGEDIDRTLALPANGLVRIENMAGTVELETWERDEVQVRGEPGDSVEDIEIVSGSNEVQVRVRNREGQRRMDGTDLHLRIPVGASIEVETVSADVSLSGSRGERIVLRTVSGDLEVEAAPGQVELHAVSGDVEFEGEVRRSAFETVSGEIVIVGAAGEIRASTVSGDVSLDAGELTQGRFEAVSGDLGLSLSLADGGRLTCDSMSGDIRLRLPASQQAEFTAQSFSGSLQTDFGESARASSGPGVMLEHRAGDNGARIRLESFSGDISIRSD